MPDHAILEAVVFDLDDTLVDHSAALRTGAIALAAAAQVPSHPDEFAARWQAIQRELYPRYLSGEMPYEQMCRERIWAAIDPGLDLQAADRLFATYMTAYQAAWRLFDDVLPCLDALSGLRLGVITNGRSAEQRRKLSVLGITQRFAHIAVSEDVGVAKPDSRIFKDSCAALGVAPDAAVYVGDSLEIDYAGALAAGLSAVWLDRSGSGSGVEAVLRVRSLGELGDLLRSARSSA